MEFERFNYVDGIDYEGGQTRKMTPYTFSDGCGKISYAMAHKLSLDIELLTSCVPSCYQVRARAYFVPGHGALDSLSRLQGRASRIAGYGRADQVGSG